MSRPGGADGVVLREGYLYKAPPVDPLKVAKYGVDVEHSVDIACTDFQALYRQHNITAVELFSLDVEGAEELVLSTIDPVCFAVVLVEMDGTDAAKDARRGKAGNELLQGNLAASALATLTTPRGSWRFWLRRMR